MSICCADSGTVGGHWRSSFPHLPQAKEANNMGKILILSVTDHEEHILNKIMETIANEPELNHIAPATKNIYKCAYAR